MNTSKDLELVGYVETTIGQIVGTKNQTFMADLTLKGSSKSRGKIIVRADSVKESNWEAALRISARNLPTSVSCLCGSNNIFFEILRGSQNDTTQFLKVYDSDPIMNTVSPIYPPFKLMG